MCLWYKYTINKHNRHFINVQRRLYATLYIGGLKLVSLVHTCANYFDLKERKATESSLNVFE